MLAQVIGTQTLHQKLTDQEIGDWKSDHLSSPSSTASTFEYEVLIDSIKSDLGASVPEELMFTDEGSWTENCGGNLLLQDCSNIEVAQKLDPVKAINFCAAALQRTLTPPLKGNAENSYNTLTSSHVGGYEVYNSPLSCEPPPTSASDSDVIYQREVKKLEETAGNCIQFDSTQLEISSLIQPDYHNTGKLTEEQTASYSIAGAKSSPLLTASSQSIELPDSSKDRHFINTSCVSATVAPTPKSYSSQTARPQTTGKKKIIILCDCCILKCFFFFFVGLFCCLLLSFFDG